MMKLGMIESAAGIAVSVDMDHAHRSLLADGFQYRMRDRMVTTYSEQRDAGVHDLVESLLDIFVAHLQPITAAEWHVSDIR